MSSSLPWISVNKRLLEAVKIINSTPPDDYQNIINNIKSLNNDEPYSEPELENLGEQLELSPKETQLLVHGTLHLLQKSSAVLLKPAALRKQLEETLRMDKEKAAMLVKAWTDWAMVDFGDLDERKKLDDVVWRLGLETGVNGASPAAFLQFKLSDFDGDGAESVGVEMGEAELVGLYAALEEVQSKLDAITH